MEKAHIVPGSYLAGLFLKYKARESLVNTSFKWFQSFSIETLQGPFCLFARSSDNPATKLSLTGD